MEKMNRSQFLRFEKYVVDNKWGRWNKDSSSNISGQKVGAQKRPAEA
jgi:hypothetical protein